MLSADEVKSLLGLQPLTFEGGFFRETYASSLVLPAAALPACGGSRRAATAIYYFLEPGTCSRLHRLEADEIYHFYLGDPVELLELGPTGSQVTRLGQDLLGGEAVQHVVPAGRWQGSRLLPGGRWALLGTTMAPGFDLSDFEAGDRAELLARYPSEAERITALTPPS